MYKETSAGKITLPLKLGILLGFMMLFGSYIFSEDIDSVNATERGDLVPKVAGVEEHLGQSVDLSLPFVDSTGKTSSLSSAILKGKPAIITPVYYSCPRMCPLLLTGIKELANEMNLDLGKDYKILTVSFDKSDNSQLANKRAISFYEKLKKPELGPKGWNFFTGSNKNIETLMGQLGYHYANDKGEFIHSAAIMIISPLGKIVRYFYGFSHDSKQVRLALIDASNGKIGHTLDRVLLYCFRFDPSKGKYTLSILRVIRIFSVVILVSLFSVLIYLRKKEKRNKL